MEAPQMSGFPKFRDGDAALMVSPSKYYQLHSSILRRNSPVFANLLDLGKPAELHAAAVKGGVTTRYCFELVRSPLGGVGRFERRVIDKSGRCHINTFQFPDLNTARTATDNDQPWDWLFGVFYNIIPDFNDETLATVLSGCMGLVEVAECINAVDAVRPFVDLALLRQNDVLWASIAANPVAWAELGRRVHSPTIFKEGITHMIGKWNEISWNDKAEFHQDIRAICEQKAKEIDTAKEAIEMRILGHYPSFMSRDPQEHPNRSSYSNDIYMWMVICYFRQWFAQAISDRRTRLADDGGFQFYNQLATGGQAYLDHEAFGEFFKWFPMSIKACNLLETNMNIMKEEVKGFVTDLLKKRVNVKDAQYPVRWLTCAVIHKDDYPWHLAEDTAAPVSTIDDSSSEIDTPLAHRSSNRGSGSNKRRRQCRGEDDEARPGTSTAYMSISGTADSIE